MTILTLIGMVGGEKSQKNLECKKNQTKFLSLFLDPFFVHFLTLIGMVGGGVIAPPPFFHRPNSQKNLECQKIRQNFYPSS